MDPGHYPFKVFSQIEHPIACCSNVNTNARFCLAGLENGVCCGSTLLEGGAGVDSYKAHFSKYFFHSKYIVCPSLCI